MRNRTINGPVGTSLLGNVVVFLRGCDRSRFRNTHLALIGLSVLFRNGSGGARNTPVWFDIVFIVFRVRKVSRPSARGLC